MSRFTLVAATLILALGIGPVPGAQADIPGPSQTSEQRPATGENVDYRSSNPGVETAADAREYWTQERMDAARPVPDWVLERAVKRAATSDAAPDYKVAGDTIAMVSQSVLPGSIGHAPIAYIVPGGSTATPSFPYPYAYTAGQISTQYYKNYPFKTQGKMFFTNAAYGAGPFYCSAGIVTSGASGNENLVLTAAHCVNSGGDNGVDGTWSQDMAFSPGRHTGLNPQGLWAFSNAFAKANWIGETNWRQDYAFGVLNSNGFGCGELQQCYGAQGVAWNQSQLREFWVYGYPNLTPYSGEQMILCTASTAARDNSVPGAGGSATGKAPLGIGCNMTTGADGANWVIRGYFGGKGGFANSVMSYKYVDEPESIYGPYFDASFQSLWEAARTDFTP